MDFYFYRSILKHFFPATRWMFCLSSSILQRVKFSMLRVGALHCEDHTCVSIIAAAFLALHDLASFCASLSSVLFTWVCKLNLNFLRTEMSSSYVLPQFQAPNILKITKSSAISQMSLTIESDQWKDLNLNSPLRLYWVRDLETRRFGLGTGSNTYKLWTSVPLL